MRRRDLLRLLTLAATGSTLSAACGQLAPPPSEETPLPTPEPSPTSAPTAVARPTAPRPTLETLPLPTFRAAIEVDPDTLEPVGQTSPASQNIVDLMVETLVRPTVDGRIAPGLAESWSESADGMTLSLVLRTGVKFHDGDDLTAAAVKGSLDRFLNTNLKVPLRAPFDNSVIDNVSIVDANTVRIQLLQPLTLLLPKLASTEMGIVSPSHQAAYPDTYSEAPIGTGPFRFRDRLKGESITLERFPAYWNRKPTYGSMSIRTVPESATRESLLLAGQVDLIVQPPPSDIPSLQKSPTVNVILTQTSRTVFVAMDLTLPGGTPLAIKKARQALNYAVDRDSIIKDVLFGAATEMDAPMASSLAGYTRTGPYGFDQGRARQLLLEAGTPELSLKFIHQAGPGLDDSQAAQVAEAIAGNFRDVGVATELQAYDPASFLAAIDVPEDKGVAHMHLFQWAPTFLDASQQMVQFSRAYWPPRGLATSHYTNDQVEALLTQAAREPDEGRRNDAYGQAQRLVWDDAPWVFLWVPSFALAHASNIRDIGALPTGKFEAAYAEPA